MKVLVINCGSSSIKYQLFDMPSEQVLAKGLAEKIGEPMGAYYQQTARGKIERAVELPLHYAAFDRVAEGLLDKEAGVLRDTHEIEALGHRVVHGGEAFFGSRLVNDEVIEAIEKCSRLAPLHNPHNLTGIKAAAMRFVAVPSVAVFDTAFHQTIPKEAYLYALPYEYYEKDGVRRYGFHGTSHRFVSRRAAEMLGKDSFTGVTCHLGNGCSLAAIRDGKSVDTSMGLTPLEGVPMGTRCGDIDAGALFFLMESKGLGVQELNNVLNKESGFLGLSGLSNDVRDVEETADQGHARAKLSIAVFAYRVKKYVGAYLAALGRADGLVFTGGIGENAGAIRAQICRGLEVFGIKLDPQKNQRCRGVEQVISADDSSIEVLVVPTNEEIVIARDTFRLVQELGAEKK